ncbi:MAG: menaquinone-dependent protoporphyrinogen IX dehydrogenase [Pseudomonadota bacterium]|nr:menaquinone-dependent protoporphyrinogen IX dehydrogenase [Pseudomonadota bacterium]
MHTLIVYGSQEGQTQKIAGHIAKNLQDKGQQVTSLALDQLPSDLSFDNYDAVIVGGSIHVGKYPKPLKKFVTTHRDRLNTIPSAFFTVCLAIHSQRVELQVAARKYGNDFLDQTGWKPALTATFAGAVRYTRYNFITRFIMKKISQKEGGSIDTSRDHEYTDWTRVEQFADEFVNLGRGQAV